MRSYFILTPPDGPDRDHRTTIFLPDSFSWIAFFFPSIWLLWHRLWLAGLLVLLIQIGSAILMGIPGLNLAGFLLGFATSVLIALEGRNLYCGSLLKRGWNLDQIINARDLDTAEEVFFVEVPKPDLTVPRSQDWSKGVPTQGRSYPDLGLFEYGGR